MNCSLTQKCLSIEFCYCLCACFLVQTNQTNQATAHTSIVNNQNRFIVVVLTVCFLLLCNGTSIDSRNNNINENFHVA